MLVETVKQAEARAGIQIPRRIIQFMIGNHAHLEMRDHAVMANMKLLNPDYEYLFFDDRKVTTFIDEEFPHYRPVFEAFKYPIQRCDFFRYLAIFRYGGFYFDLDVLLARGLSSLLKYGCVFPFEALSVSRFMRRQLGMDWQIGNYGFGATAGHPFLDAVIRNCIKAQKDPIWVKPMMPGSPPLIRDEFFVINSTGPGLISRTFAENKELAKTVTVLFPEDVCDRRNWHYFGNFGIHMRSSSWRTNRNVVSRKVTDYCWRWMTRMRLRQSRRLGKSRHHPCDNTSGPA